MRKTTKLLFLLLPIISGAQEYSFNGETNAVLYKGFANTLIINKPAEDSGTPLCFDGTVKITPNQKQTTLPLYYVEVLDTVGRKKGRMNMSKYLRHPDGFKEKVFIDKFEFEIVPLPEVFLFVGPSLTGEKIEPDHMRLKIGLQGSFPETAFVIKEYTIIANKEIISIKNTGLTPQAREFILKQKEGTEIKINAVYTDPVGKKRRVGGLFYL